MRFGTLKKWLPSFQTATFLYRLASRRTLATIGAVAGKQPGRWHVGCSWKESSLAYFSGAQWTNYPARYYRITAP
jgi:hypothetical protein